LALAFQKRTPFFHFKRNIPASDETLEESLFHSSQCDAKGWTAFHPNSYGFVFASALPAMTGVNPMPRTARVLLPGHIYHLTHRCHNGSFFLRFETTRIEYRRRLWKAINQFKIIILNFCITSNHTHLLLIVRHPIAISSFMRLLEGQFASQYNRRKHRRGAFWSERYHSTLIENGSHFWNCMRYIDLNMVRAGVVNHPRGWRWCGYQEIAGLRQRYRILDLSELLRLAEFSSYREFVTWYETELDHSLEIKKDSGRQPHWSESIAVGSRAFVEGIAMNAKNPKRLVIQEWSDDTWYVRESLGDYR
jgi:putative transposase